MRIFLAATCAALSAYSLAKLHETGESSNLFFGVLCGVAFFGIVIHAMLEYLNERPK